MRPNSSLHSKPDCEVLVRVDGVSKKFCRSLKKSLWYGVCDIGAELNPFRRQVVELAGDDLQVTSRNQSAEGGSILPATSYPPPAPSPPLRPGEFWAVNDVSFELRRGECLGLIGHNGAGKTTLLKMLTGLIKPDAGTITMRGRIAALIALGAGFNPILTGRENIYINGSVLGLSKKETDARIEEIIDFADITEFIDSPVQSYSSGMTVRLGFAVATALDPDVLILDEVLAVGDAAFRNKCYNKIGKMRGSAATIFVSHSMDQVAQVCDRILVLNHGQGIHLGDLSEGVSVYESLNSKSDEAENAAFEKVEAPVRSVQIRLQPACVSHGETSTFEMEIDASEPISDACLRIVFYDQMGVPFAEWNSFRQKISLAFPQGKSVTRVSLGPAIFKAGKYRLGVALNDKSGVSMLCWSFKKHTFTVAASTSVGPNIALQSDIQVTQI